MGSFAEMERRSEVDLQQRHTIEARAVSPAVQALNDKAEFEIWGSAGAPVSGNNAETSRVQLTQDVKGNNKNLEKMEAAEYQNQSSLGEITWFDPENPDKVLYRPGDKPIPGKIADIASNPKYGKTEGERKANADEYLEEIESLASNGFELCQAKLIVDLREKDFVGTNNLTAKLMTAGQDAAKAHMKAISFYAKRDLQRLEVIKSKGVFSHEEYDNLLAQKNGKLAQVAGQKAVASPAPASSPEPAKKAEPKHSPEPAKKAAPAPSPSAPNKPVEEAKEVKQPAKKLSPKAEQEPASDIEHPAFRHGRRIVLTEVDHNQIVIENNEVKRLHLDEDGQLVKTEDISYLDEREALPKMPTEGQIWKFVSIEDGTGKEVPFESHTIIGLQIFEQAKTVSEKSSDDSEPENKPGKELVVVPEPAQLSRRQRAFAAAKKRMDWAKSHTPDKIKNHRKVVAASLAGLLAIGGIVGGLEATSGNDSHQTVTQTNQNHAKANQKSNKGNRPNVSKVSPSISYAPNGQSASIKLK